MRSAVISENDANTAGILLIVLAAMIASVASWPWPMISAFVAIVALSVIVHVNIVRPRVRRARLKTPTKAWFLIPAQRHHGCDFAVQDADEHLVKTIVLTKNTDAIIDLRFEPRLFFSNSEIVVGCEGDDAPKATEYFNRFVVQGEGAHIIPGAGNRHYIDKHGFYHYREGAAARQWSRGTFGEMAFKFRASAVGKYPVDIYFLGEEAEGKNSELTIVVEERPQADMPRSSSTSSENAKSPMPSWRSGLKKHGHKSETEASITNKLARGTFPATFFLACLAALELDGVALDEI